MAVKFLNPGATAAVIGHAAEMLPSPDHPEMGTRHRNPAPDNAEELHVIDYDREAVLLQSPSGWVPGEHADFRGQGPKSELKKAALEHAREESLKMYVGNKRVNPGRLTWNKLSSGNYEAIHHNDLYTISLRGGGHGAYTHYELSRNDFSYAGSPTETCPKKYKTLNAAKRGAKEWSRQKRANPYTGPATRPPKDYGAVKLRLSDGRTATFYSEHEARAWANNFAKDGIHAFMSGPGGHEEFTVTRSKKRRHNPSSGAWSSEAGDPFIYWHPDNVYGAYGYVIKADRGGYQWSSFNSSSDPGNAGHAPTLAAAKKAVEKHGRFWERSKKGGKKANPSGGGTKRAPIYRYHVTGPQGGKYLTSTFDEARDLTKNGGTIKKLKKPRKG